MPMINIVAADGSKTAETVEVSEKLFNTKAKPVVVREVLNQYLANQRQGNASTKEKGDVSGGGKKPWRQKGTGRARGGSTRSPLWRHGGVTFGPHPRDFSYTIPKKKKRLAFYSVLTSKREEERIKLVKEIVVAEAKTKSLVGFLKSLGVSEEKNLILLDKVNRTVYLAGRNLPRVKVSIVDNINIFDLLYHDNIIATPESLKRLEELIG